MREILFRAYDKTMKRYKPFDGEHDTMLISRDGKIDYYNLQNGSGFDEYILEQFTGLTDKNGKKIFEGDIVRINHYLHGDLVVSFQDGCFCFGLFNGKSFGDFVSVRESMGQARRYFEEELVVEVIGNINDNPELLP